MSRLFARAVRLLKFGAVAGAALGIGRLILQRRRRSQADESSWPTIAETAAQNGQPVDDDTDAGSDTSESSAGATEETSDDAGGDAEDKS